MIGRWFAAHKSLVATVSSGTVIAAVLGTTAFLSSGFTAQRMDLDDGAAWVVNDAKQAVGRANPQVAELNSVVRAQGTDLEVVQRGSTVLLVDRTNASLDIIDPATSEAGDTVALPPERPEVWIAGENAVIMAQGTGEVWVEPLSDLQSFDPNGPASLTFGRDSVAAVDDSGVLYVYRPDTGEVIVTDVAGATQDAQKVEVDFPSSARSFSITAVAGRWAVLDATDRRLATAEGTRSLGALVPAGSDPVLQQPSTTGDGVLVATRRGLVEVPMSGGSPRRVTTGTGAPAAPVVSGRCSYAAWSASAAWRSCGGNDETFTLSGLSAAAQLNFAVNGPTVVLNDVASGAGWAVQQRGDRIDNWDDLLARDDTRQEQQNNEDIPPETEPQEQPPVAVDDELGARPGKATVLPVLLNDYDPNGDVLVIDAVTPIPESQGRVDVIAKGQQVLITLTAQALGTVSFDYTIDDGRGGSDSARVTVRIRQPGENSPPVQVRTTKTTVQAGQQVTTQVLGDWVDPDGDAMYLESASATTEGDGVTAKPDGVVLFRDSGAGGGLKSVTLGVSDGSATGTGSLVITVRPAGQVPIFADPFEVQATAGQVVTVSPLEHVRGGTGTVRLNAVPAKTGVTVVPSFDKGTFTFSSDRAGTHYLEYVVTDGQQTATGQVRVDVAAPPDSNAKPITIPKTVFVRFQATQTIDVAGTDIDPAGGVLVVTGIDAPDFSAGVRAEVLEQRSVRVTLVAPIDAPLTFGYRVSNGLAESSGTITVVQIPPLALPQPPIARDDTVTVRAGDTIDIPVLDNDEQPDGLDVTLDPDLVSTVPSGAGLLFASGDRLRYLAPTTVGNYTAVYRIHSAGQSADATVRIAVREKNVSTNNAPVPVQLTARVFAGDTVRIDVPLTGIDPDGDSVQLLGQETSPDKGSVTRVGADFIDYTAGAYSTGTDTFTYSVMDGLGARATGTIRVGISPRTSGARAPVAVEDAVTVRPGKTVTVQVLANDSDPDGGALTVTKVDANGSGAAAKVVQGSYVQVTPPTAPGTYGVIYTIANASGATSSAFVQVTVDPEAPLSRPIVSDTVLSVTDVLGTTSVDVPVLDNVFFADGPVDSLGVSLVPGYSGQATVTGAKRIRVTIGRLSQVIPFAVSHPDDPDVRSYGFLRVPGLDDALPQLNTRAPKITVKSEQTVTLDLNDYVVTIGGGPVRLADTTSVSATHANGDALVVDDHTLAFTSADHYFGPASLSFEVTDGSPSDPSARRATLTLPITVLARDNQPPVFQGAALDFEPGEQKDIDLVRLTNYPYDKDLPELAYTVADPLPAGFDVQLNGQRLVISASDGAAKGTTASVTVGVKDATSTGQAGRLSLRVVASSRPLARPVPDSVIAPRGQTTTVDVLANDQAGNPFPDTPLRVVQVRGADAASLPDGVTVVPNGDRSKLSVTVAPTTAPVDVNLQYQVQDATADPDRLVWGNVRISVQDRPDPVTGVTVTEFGDRTLRLAWTPGVSNNSPITGYEVQEYAADGTTLISTTACVSTTCTVQTPGNGPSNAVRLRVVAINAIGRSDPAGLGSSIWSDIIPPSPTGLSSIGQDHGLRVSWQKPDDGGKGSPISYYVVTVAGVSSTVPVDPTDPIGTVYSKTVTSPQAINGSATPYSVSARNSAPNSLATWNAATGTGMPAGPPIPTGAPSASTTPSSGASSATLSWAGIFSDNGAPMRTYYAVLYTGAAPTCTVSGADTGNGQVTGEPQGAFVRVKSAGSTNPTSTTFGDLQPNVTYTAVVFAFNGQGCTASATSTVVARTIPPVPSGVSLSALEDAGDGTYDYSVTDFSSAATDADQLRYRLIGDGVDGSAQGPAALPVKLRTGNNSQYGVPVQVQVQACKSYPELPAPLCSDWSSTFAVGVPIWLRMDGLVGQPSSSGLPPYNTLWSWTGVAGGPGYTRIAVSCDNGSSWRDIGTGPDSCSTPDYLLPGQVPRPQLLVTTTAGDTKTRGM